MTHFQARMMILWLLISAILASSAAAQAQPSASCQAGAGLPAGGCGSGQCPSDPGGAPWYERFGCGDCMSDPVCGPWLTVTADTLILQRSTTRSQPLFQAVGGGTVVNSQTDLNFPVAVGPQFSAVAHGPSGWELEVGYFQVDGWEANAVVPGTSIMTTGVQQGFVVNDASARYISAIYMGEINLRRQWLSWLNLLAGYRMGALNETYRAEGVGAAVPVPVSLTNRTFNHLYGFQLGADAEAYNNGRLRINCLCKAGVYGNSASQDSQTSDGGIVQGLGAERGQMAFMGEASVVLTYQITRHVATRLVYEAAWIEGVALAPEQVGANSFTALSAGIDTHGGVFYQGGGAGLEVKY